MAAIAVLRRDTAAVGQGFEMRGLGGERVDARLADAARLLRAGRTS